MTKTEYHVRAMSDGITMEMIRDRAERDGIGEVYAYRALQAEAALSRVTRLQNFAQDRINDLPEGDTRYALQAMFDWLSVELEGLRSAQD